MLLGDGLRRSQQFAPGSRLLSVRFAARGDEGQPLFQHAAPLVLPASAVPQLESTARTLVAAQVTASAQAQAQAQAPTDLATDLHRAAVLLGFASAWWRTAVDKGWQPWRRDGIDPRLAAAMTALEHYGGIAAVPYTALRDATGWSRTQIDRRFAATFSTSPSGWLAARMRDRAMQRLANGQESVKELAAALGFADASHFGKWFRRQTGQSPRQARCAPL